ncbi:hypothetical protein CU041_01845 [Thalassospira povalilytica]|uniref:Uncharacterized protein n=1 Tax=Thalassospira povalilytica TaxID=732237 RepID=A0ABX4RDN9_9PROT|nr:hypothetical protein CU041_01845 [Thalassospira povalilytica]
MDMRKIGAAAQSQPASVDTDGTRLLLTGGKHDGVGCRMPPDAPGCPRMPKAARWARRAEGDTSWNMSRDTSLDIYWNFLGGIAGMVIGEPREVRRAA